MTPRRRRGQATPLQRRAARLLAGGLAGGHAALAACVVGFGVARGPAAAIWSLLAGLVAVVFFTIGQGIQVIVANSDPKVVMVSSLVSFALRAAGLGTLLAWAQANSDHIASIDPVALAATAIAVVIGWIGAEIWTFTRLRIPTYDTESDSGL